MKTRIIVSVLAVAAICAAAITSQAFMKTDKNPTKDAEGHVLTSQWKAYNAALKAGGTAGNIGFILTKND